MLLDSFYEGVAANSLNMGIARLNTRFAFYAYERRRVAQNSRLAAPLCKDAPKGLNVLDPAMVRYVFHKPLV